VSYLDMLKAAKERLLLRELSEKSINIITTGNNSKKAPPAKEANEAKELPRRPPPPSYAYPWPDFIAGRGRRRVGPFDPCARACGRSSWVRYGTMVLCLPCATRETPP
jgi:hypothetical protein